MSLKNKNAAGNFTPHGVSSQFTPYLRPRPNLEL
jgi:hypothetical protein